MTQPRRAWIESFSDPAVLSDLFAAAKSYMAEGDDCDPEHCPHPEQRMTPIEFAQWIEEQAAGVKRAPIRLDHRENRSAGQAARRSMEFASTG